ncbi:MULTISPECIES: FTR1 family iron permease [Acetobacter]|jgi:high-affinity iron transporter|uniref:High-affinity iron transporter n=2 Tax=Acetobacter TaxID=434 RepID=A0A841QDS4_9PROT|nr:FTR1 family protein [Acetobacter lovaniensis]MBB6457039.1 high-affinity iron transporter [Acetobacter lovaniensis]MCI1697625.1 FTR1 family protein [Acetobacter lovaniensis]MCI1795908.1 FTR1 family protein [Acetobacter lovaniensis]MCP1239614.1 FTR1 family protein [Acetobacter lovaniensis]NHN81373.1 iron permease [Acetobacter lovaniensis]
MLGSLIIVFREVIEAGLVVGIVLAATRGIAGRGWWVAGGVAAGVAGAAIAAAFAGALSTAFSGNGQDIFSAAILCLAVLMLSWHVIWMARHGRELAQQMQQMGAAVSSGSRSLGAMATVVAVAVLREGMEVVLFLYGIAVSTHVGAFSLLSGGLLGVLGGAALSYALYRGLIIIPLRHLFAVTNILVSLLAAGMASQAAALLASDDLIPALGYDIWDTSWLLSDGSLAGRTAKALAGYTDRPTGVQILVWGLTLVCLLATERFVRTRPHPSPSP